MKFWRRSNDDEWDDDDWDAGEWEDGDDDYDDEGYDYDEDGLPIVFAGDPEVDLVTRVWLLDGLICSTPGYLILQGSRVRLELEKSGPLTFDTRLDLDKSEIEDVKWPRIQLDAGCNFRVGGEKIKLSFIRPENTKQEWEHGGVAEIPASRANGKLWKEILS